MYRGQWDDACKLDLSSSPGNKKVGGAKDGPMDRGRPGVRRTGGFSGLVGLRTGLVLGQGERSSMFEFGKRTDVRNDNRFERGRKERTIQGDREGIVP